MRSNKSPSDCWFQLPRNSSPTSAGPASPPPKSVPWQAEHRELAVVSPRLACASLYTPAQIPDPVGAAAVSCVAAGAAACAWDVTAEQTETAQTQAAARIR